MNEKDTYELINKLISYSEKNEIDIEVKPEDLDKITKDYFIESDVKNRIKENVKFRISQENIYNNKNKKIKKAIIAASIISLILISPIATKAAVEKLYNYIDTTSEIVQSNGNILKIEKSLTEQVGEDIVTLESFTMNIEKKSINLKIKGIGSIADKESVILKIGNEYLKWNSNGIGSSGNEWTLDLGFDYDGEYNKDDNIQVYVELENKNKVSFKPILQQASSVSSYRDLGPWDAVNGVDIVGVVKEEGNIVDVNFMSSLETNQIAVMDYGNPYNYNNEVNKNDYGILLKDINGNQVSGEIVNHGDRNNNFKFDTTNLVKPYKIIIPQISVSAYGQISTSGEIKIPIPKENEVIDFDKEIEIIRQRDYGILNENNSFKITQIKRMGEDISLYIEYPKDNEKIKRRNISIYPTRGLFLRMTHSGYGTISQENGTAYRLDITPRNINSKNLKLDFTDGEFVIYGPWEIEIK